MLKLIQPTKKYKATYIEALHESMKDSLYPEGLTYQIENFESYIQETRNAKRGVTSGVPRSEYWLMDGDIYIGTIQIRHTPSGRYPNIKSHIYYEIRPSKRSLGYGTHILRLGLKKAKTIGLSELIIVCDEDNIGSKKIIEANGGVLLSKEKIPDGSILKYKIKS